MKTRNVRRLIRDGDMVAEVTIELRDDHEEWGPTMSPADAAKLDIVRQAMRLKDYPAVARLATLFRLTPFATGELKAG